MAATRAEDLLIATAHRWGRSQRSPLTPSDFLLAIREAAAAGHGDVLHWAAEPRMTPRIRCWGPEQLAVPLRQARKGANRDR